MINAFRSWKKRWMQRRTGRKQDSSMLQRIELIREIDAAKKEWWRARQQFNFVTDPDQIDYAVYAWEAAEKRYEMLLRAAKRSGVSRLDEHTGRVMEG